MGLYLIKYWIGDESIMFLAPKWSFLFLCVQHDCVQLATAAISNSTRQEYNVQNWKVRPTYSSLREWNFFLMHRFPPSLPWEIVLCH